MVVCAEWWWWWLTGVSGAYQDCTRDVTQLSGRGHGFGRDRTGDRPFPYYRNSGNPPPPPFVGWMLVLLCTVFSVLSRRLSAFGLVRGNLSPTGSRSLLHVIDVMTMEDSHYYYLYVDCFWADFSSGTTLYNAAVKPDCAARRLADGPLRPPRQCRVFVSFFLNVFFLFFSCLCLGWTGSSEDVGRIDRWWEVQKTTASCGALAWRTIIHMLHGSGMKSVFKCTLFEFKNAVRMRRLWWIVFFWIKEDFDHEVCALSCHFSSPLNQHPPARLHTRSGTRSESPV